MTNFSYNSICERAAAIKKQGCERACMFFGFIVLLLASFMVVLPARAEVIEFSHLDGNDAQRADYPQWLLDDESNVVEYSTSSWAWVNPSDSITRLRLKFFNTSSSTRQMTISPHTTSLLETGNYVECYFFPHENVIFEGYQQLTEDFYLDRCYDGYSEVVPTPELQSIYKIYAGGLSPHDVKSVVYDSDIYGPTNMSCWGSQPSGKDLAMEVYGGMRTYIPGGGGADLSAYWYIPLDGTTKTEEEWNSPDTDYIIYSNFSVDDYPDEEVFFDMRVEFEGDIVYDREHFASNYEVDIDGTTFYAFKWSPDFVFGSGDYTLSSRVSTGEDFSTYSPIDIIAGNSGPVWDCTGDEPFYTACFWKNIFRWVFVPPTSSWDINVFATLRDYILTKVPFCYSSSFTTTMSNWNAEIGAMDSYALDINVPLTDGSHLGFNMDIVPESGSIHDFVRTDWRTICTYMIWFLVGAYVLDRSSRLVDSI